MPILSVYNRSNPRRAYSSLATLIRTTVSRFKSPTASPFRINTCESLSKQATSDSGKRGFRTNADLTGRVDKVQG
jgi:hypothetical protein